MQCNKCRNGAVFFQSYSGRHLCGRHFALDIETRAKRSIRSHCWIRAGDHIAVVISGDRRSAALLCFLQKLIAGRRDIRLSAVPACGEDTGTAGWSAAVKVAESLRIPCIEMPLPRGSGTAAEEKVTKIALALSLDDIAQGVLAQFLFGNTGRLVHPSSARSGQLPVICPFIAVPSDELDLYWEIGGTGIDLPPGTPARDTIPQETGAILEDYARRHPATKYALLHLGEQLSKGNAAALPFTDTDGCDSGDGVHGMSRFCGGVVTGHGS
jgi:tRNA(Ile)-lysidine synthase TilS/MesJ